MQIFNNRQLSKSFYLDRVYICPFCNCGQISLMPMMQDTLSCDRCHHLFTANDREQLVKLVDYHILLTWYWKRERWQIASNRLKLDWLCILIVIVIALLPIAFLGFVSYLLSFLLVKTSVFWIFIVCVFLFILLNLLSLTWLFIEELRSSQQKIGLYRFH